MDHQHMHTYNSNQPPLRLREYGRNIQRLVVQLKQEPDKAIRTQYAHAILKVMNLLHSGNGKTGTEFSQKRWDDLFIIADYDLDIDSPYPVPNKDLLYQRPQRLSYSKEPIKYRHCGRLIELLVKKALAVTDPSRQADMIINIGRLIKSFSATWNKDNLDNNTIISIIQDFAGEKLALDIEKLKAENSFNMPTQMVRDKNKTHKKRRINFAPKAK